MFVFVLRFSGFFVFVRSCWFCFLRLDTWINVELIYICVLPPSYWPLERFNFQHSTVWNEKEVCLMSQRELPLYRDFIYSLLQECTHQRDLAAVRHAHSLMVRSGLDTVAVLGDHLIRAFTSCGCLIEAKEAFYRIPNPSVYTWNAIISAHAQLGECETAVHIYHHHMQQQGIKPDRVTFLSLLKACSGLRTAKQGMVIHHHIILDGFESERVIGNTSIDMYAKCGSVDEARKVFDLMVGRRNEVSWQALLVGYVQHDLVTPALELLKAMLLEGVTPSKVMFLCTLKACASRGAIDNGRRLHEQIKNCGLEADVVIGSTLLDMYSKCGSLQEACKVFDELLCRNVVTWCAMIAAHVRHGHSLAALELFEKMQQESIKPDEAVFSCILKACGSLRAIEQGKSIHEQISSSGLHGDVVLGNTLIDMYAKCGSMEEAWKVFDKLQGRDVVSWGTMITGYVQHEHPLAALQLFEKMQDKGIQTSKIIYVGILKACGSIGAISQGRLMHDNLIKNCADYDVVIDNSLLDMYAKCGSLGEAHRVLDTVPTPDVVSWGTMIAGCAQHGDVCMARQCLEGMHQQGLKPDVAISTSILVASSHTGLVEEGHWHLTHKMNELCLASDVEHFNSRIDLLGRAGFLEEADILISSLPILPDTVGWRSLLSGCRTYGNMQLGRKCFDELVKLNPIDASGLVLMSNIFADDHLWEDAKTLQERRKSIGAWKRPGKAWIEVDNVVHEFIVGGTVHPQSESIHVKSCRLSKYIKEEGHLLLLE